MFLGHPGDERIAEGNSLGGLHARLTRRDRGLFAVVTRGSDFIGVTRMLDKQ